MNSESPTPLMELPRHAIDALCATTINLAQQLDALLADLEKRAGYAVLRIEVIAGTPKFVKVERSFKLS